MQNFEEVKGHVSF